MYLTNNRDGTQYWAPRWSPDGSRILFTEFRGREFVGFGRMEDGTDLSFLAHDKLEPGATVTLGAAPDRVLVFGGGAA